MGNTSQPDTSSAVQAPAESAATSLSPHPHTGDVAATCPTCGSPIAEKANWDTETRTFMANGWSIRFTRVEAMVMDVLWNRRRRPIYSLREFSDLVWANDIDGGPDNANNDISVFIAKIRTKIKATGYTVTQNRGRPKVGLCLAEISA